MATTASHKETEESFLLFCPSLTSTRQALIEYSMNYLLSYPDLLPLVCECLAADLVQFWLDCSTMCFSRFRGIIVMVSGHKARLALLKSDLRNKLVAKLNLRVLEYYFYLCIMYIL